MAELEKEPGLALEEEQGKSPPTGTRGTPAQGLEWEQRETRVAVESLGGRELGEEALVEEAGAVEYGSKCSLQVDHSR